jgi:hypothetical protein
MFFKKKFDAIGVKSPSVVIIAKDDNFTGVKYTSRWKKNK